MGHDLQPTLQDRDLDGLCADRLATRLCSEVGVMQTACRRRAGSRVGRAEFEVPRHRRRAAQLVAELRSRGFAGESGALPGGGPGGRGGWFQASRRAFAHARAVAAASTSARDALLPAIRSTRRTALAWGLVSEKPRRAGRRWSAKETRTLLRARDAQAARRPRQLGKQSFYKAGRPVSCRAAYAYSERYIW
jgi:hypothetical protein